MLAIEFVPDDKTFQGADDYISDLVDVVKAKLHGHRKVETVQSLGLFNKRIEQMKDQMYFVVSKLKTVSPEHYTSSWLAVVSELFSGVFNLREDMEDILEACDTSDKDYNRVRTTVGQLYSEIIEVFIGFMGGNVAERLVGMCGVSVRVKERVMGLIDSVCDCGVSNLAVDCGAINTSEAMLQPTARFVRLYFEQNMNQGFGLLAKFMKIIYMTGNSCLFEQIYSDNITPSLPVKLFKKRMPYDDVERYYKYTAFNLFYSSIQSFDHIEDKFNWEADTYFKCLLAMPTMDCTIHPRFGFAPEASPVDTPGKSWGPIGSSAAPGPAAASSVPGTEGPGEWGFLRKYIPTVPGPDGSDEHGTIRMSDLMEVTEEKSHKRQEVSMLFVLNSILMCHDLEEIVSPVPQVEAEMDNFHKLLTASLSRKIKREGSLLKTYGTGMKLAKSQEEAGADPSECQSLTSILFHGSYRQKQKLMSSFGMGPKKQFPLQNFQETYNLESEGSFDFRDLYDSTDANTRPGFIKYYHLLDLMSRFVGLLTLKYIVKSIGGETFQVSALQSMFKRSNIEHVFKVKPLFDYAISNDDVIVKLARPRVNNDEMILHQLELVKGNRELETSINSFTKEIRTQK